MAIGRALERRHWAQFALLLLVAIAFRCPAYGEWNYAIDDQYFALVGRRLLAGDLLYVDIWDRKPPLLYLTYAAIGWINPSTLAYQLVATLSAALGAWGTTRIARLIAPSAASLMAGIAYLALLTRFGGGNGEAAVFFNPLMLFTAWSIATSIARLRAGDLPRRVLLGMLSAGLAIGFKQSAAFEAVFFGIAVLALLGRAALGWRALALAALGALPMVLIALYYAAIGHFPQLWQALVLSNLGRAYDPARLARGLALAGLLCLPLALAAAGWWRARDAKPAALPFLGCWAGAAIAGVAIFPGLYLHYALPLAAPLAILAAPFFARPRIGVIGFVALIALNLATSDMFALSIRARARPAAAELVAQVHSVTPHGRLLVFGMPSYLYAELGTRPPSPLAFPAHFYEGAESHASGIDEVAELARVLAAAPETVVVQEPLPAAPLNQANVDQLARYLSRCSDVRRLGVYDHEGEKRIAIHSRCGAAGPVPIAAPVR